MRCPFSFSFSRSLSLFLLRETTFEIELILAAERDELLETLAARAMFFMQILYNEKVSFSRVEDSFLRNTADYARNKMWKEGKNELQIAINVNIVEWKVSNIKRGTNVQAVKFEWQLCLY